MLAVVEDENDLQFEVSFRFLHDRVQQAAYSLIGDKEKKATHLRIGRLRLKNSGNHEEDVFDIVNQLNYSKDLITTKKEKTELAALNLLAGKKAKASSAIESARDYLGTALDLLGNAGWKQHFELALSIHKMAAET